MQVSTPKAAKRQDHIRKPKDHTPTDVEYPTIKYSKKVINTEPFKVRKSEVHQNVENVISHETYKVKNITIHLLAEI